MPSPVKNTNSLVKLNETCMKNGYVLLQLCGEGAYSAVYLAKSNKNDGRKGEDDNEYVRPVIL